MTRLAALSRSFRRAPVLHPPNSIILDDAFSDADGSLLSAHTIAPLNTPGASWSCNNTWTISANKLVCSNAGALLATLESGLANCTLELWINGSNNGFACGLVGRYQDATHYWLFGMAGGNLYLYENNAGFTLRASAGSMPASGLLSVKLNGSQLSVSYANSLPLTYTSTSFQAQTKHGLRLVNLVAVDNFKVRA